MPPSSLGAASSEFIDEVPMTHNQGGRSPLADYLCDHQMCHQLATAAAPRRASPSCGRHRMRLRAHTIVAIRGRLCFWIKLCFTVNCQCRHSASQ